MKKSRKNMLALVLSAACLGTMVVALASCGGGDTPIVDGVVSFGVSTLSGQKTIAVGSTDTIKLVNVEGKEENDLELAYSSSDSRVLSVSDAGVVTALEPGVASVIVVEDGGATGSVELTVSGEKANGYYNYSAMGYQKQEEILGVLEKYAQDTYLTGIPLAGDGQYVMYNDRVQKGVESYIKGYGFGVLHMVH